MATAQSIPDAAETLSDTCAISGVSHGFIARINSPVVPTLWTNTIVLTA